MRPVEPFPPNPQYLTVFFRLTTFPKTRGGANLLAGKDLCSRSSNRPFSSVFGFQRLSGLNDSIAEPDTPIDWCQVTRSADTNANSGL